jgi:CubicO group peptidase (beta-lactamase class C family)
VRSVQGLAAVALALSAVAGGVAGGVAPAAAQPADDTVPGDEWVVEAPEVHGMDPAALDAARDYAFAEGMNTQGVVVVRDGVIVAEWYADGAGPESWAASWSMAKSVASAVVGIAIAEGKIPSVDEPMTTYFPDWAGTDKAAITLRHVLQMESGLDWDEDYDPSALGESEIIEMVLGQPDQLAFAAGRPAEVPPGTRWSYSSGDSMLLSRVIEQATGMPADEYARTVLFEPLGIDQIDWWRDARGHTLTYCCVDTTSRDFARFGLLYLREGLWGDEQVVPESWVSDSLAGSEASSGGYGFQWWLGGGDDLSYFSARGHDGQYIYVVPELDLVVVRNGTYGKSPCEPVADPNLFSRYPSGGLVPGQGTSPPAEWSDQAFLGPIVESITGAGAEGAAGDEAAPAPGPAATSAGPGSPAQAACDAEPPDPGPAGTPGSPGSPGSSPPSQATPAVPVPATPDYTG